MCREEQNPGVDPKIHEHSICYWILCLDLEKMETEWHMTVGVCSPEVKWDTYEMKMKEYWIQSQSRKIETKNMWSFPKY